MTLMPASPPTFRRSRWRLTLVGALTVLTTGSLIAAANTGAAAHGLGRSFFSPGNLLVSSRSTTRTRARHARCHGPAARLHRGCVPATAAAPIRVWNNDSVDASFGVTSPIFLDQLTPSGQLVNTLRSRQRPGPPARTSW